MADASAPPCTNTDKGEVLTRIQRNAAITDTTHQRANALEPAPASQCQQQKADAYTSDVMTPVKSPRGPARLPQLPPRRDGQGGAAQKVTHVQNLVDRGR